MMRGVRGGVWQQGAGAAGCCSTARSHCWEYGSVRGCGVGGCSCYQCTGISMTVVQTFSCTITRVQSHSITLTAHVQPASVHHRLLSVHHSPAPGAVRAYLRATTCAARSLAQQIARALV